MSEHQDQKLRVLGEQLVRSRIASYLGMSFSGARDLYEVLGYSRDIKFEEYWNIYTRGCLGKRIIHAPVDTTWSGDVSVYENQEPDETEFEKAWKALDEQLHIIPKLTRFDVLASLGRYAVLFLGFDDNKEFDQPLENSTKRKLLYLQAYHEGSAEIIEWEQDPKNVRFGMPKIYQLSLNLPGAPLSMAKTRVHHTRIIHLAEGLLENDVFGTPRLQSVFNRVQDLEKLAGGSAEMFWQGALGGKAFKTADGATLSPQTAEDLQIEIDEYIHGLRRYLRLQNMDVQDIAPAVSDPKGHIDTQLDLIAGDTGIPKRILVGSERGELASSQDETNWLNRIQERRKRYAEPFILRTFVDLLIKHGVLPTPKDGYQVFWPDLWSSSETEKATTAKIKSEAIATYVGAMGADQVVPPEFFLEEVMGFDTDQIDRIKEILKTEEIELDLEPEPLPGTGGQMAGGSKSGQQEEQKPKATSGQKQNTSLDNEDEEDDYIENFNPNHSPEDGRFTSGVGGSAGSDAEARDIAKERGYKVPPGWTGVKVNRDPNADLQVIGVDSKGRKQYIYSANARSRNDAAKFARVSEFSKAQPKIVERIKKDMATSDEAKALYLISKTGFRVGSDRETHASKKAYGASTLESSHVKVDGNKVTFNFTGKKGVTQNHTIEDSDIANMFRGKEGRLFNTTDGKIRDYLHSIAPGYKVKDFRTHIATGEALKMIKTLPSPTSERSKAKSIMSVAKHVASILGNTPAMARNAYINPAVFRVWEAI